MDMRSKILVFCLVAFLVGCGTSSSNITVLNGTCKVDEPKCEIKDVSVVGTYKATLPCADCDGIDATLNLKADNTFTYEMIYKTTDSDKDLQSGTYSIKDNIITTINLYKEQTKFKFDNGVLKLLDMDGNVITGVLESFYIFKKTN